MVLWIKLRIWLRCVAIRGRRSVADEWATLYRRAILHSAVMLARRYLIRRAQMTSVVAIRSQTGETHRVPISHDHRIHA
jgi:hypothetical protein